MFADATIVLEQSHEVVTLPRTAVAFTLYGETVFLLQEDTDADKGTTSWKAYRKPVKSGETRDGRLAVTGLEAGQLVALDTQHRLLEGSPVEIVNLAALDGKAPTADVKTPTTDGKTPTADRKAPTAEAE